MRLLGLVPIYVQAVEIATEKFCCFGNPTGVVIFDPTQLLHTFPHFMVMTLGISACGFNSSLFPQVDC